MTILCLSPKTEMTDLDFLSRRCVLYSLTIGCLPPCLSFPVLLAFSSYARIHQKKKVIGSSAFLKALQLEHCVLWAP